MRLQIADVNLAKGIPAGATSVTLTADLKAGKTRLQTWLTQADGQSRGAYFVEVRRVE